MSGQPTREARLAALALAAIAAAVIPYDETANMCPNCQTPWKCNGPHLPSGADPTPADLLKAATYPRVIAAMAAVVGAARKAAWVFDCLCEPGYTERNLHGPECHLEDGDALCDALAAWDALEEAK